MNRDQLIANIKTKRSFLCIGLDTDIEKIPQHLRSLDDPVFEFNKRIIDATKAHCVAYKPNIAFYERMGINGWNSLKKTLDYIPDDIFTIADAKRGDIGNTSEMYAGTFFNTYDFDSVTVAPYMGSDSVKPFLKFQDKWVILLALTSNPGSLDFQTQSLSTGERVFERVLEVSSKWGNAGNMMYVIGATRAEMLEDVRKLIPDHFLLVPGVGAQGGSLEEVCKYGMNKDIGLLVNSSRGIIYASSGEDFESAAASESKKLQLSMEEVLKQNGIV